LISHGHVRVDGKKVDIASFQVKEGQEVSIAETSSEIAPVVEARETAGGITPPEWLETNLDELKGKLIRVPERQEIKVPVNEQMIIELYSRL